MNLQKIKCRLTFFFLQKHRFCYKTLVFYIKFESCLKSSGSCYYFFSLIFLHRFCRIKCCGAGPFRRLRPNDPAPLNWSDPYQNRIGGFVFDKKYLDPVDFESSTLSYQCWRYRYRFESVQIQITLTDTQVQTYKLITGIQIRPLVCPENHQ